VKRYLAEAIGTFFLVLLGAGAIVINDLQDQAVTHLGIALAFGLVVMAMISAIGETSGAHMNPAVTLGFWVSGRFPTRDILPYVVAQLIGALLASVLLRTTFPEHVSLGATSPSGSWMQTATLEFLITFLLMFVILNVATGGKEKGIVAGITIGGTVALAALVVGPITGASMNPARSIGPALVSLQKETIWELWLYTIPTVLGAVSSVPIFNVLKGNTASVAAEDKLTEVSEKPS